MIPRGQFRRAAIAGDSLVPVFGIGKERGASTQVSRTLTDTCLLDEFANQKIPNFQHLISVIRSREISAHIVVQTQSQLKAIYKDNAETIIGNCSCVLFLGGKERSTLKEISETLGKETIDLYNTSDTRGSQRSMGVNYQKLGKDVP